jgi:hypothetical protein
MNRLVLVIAISLAVPMTVSATALAGPKGEEKRAEKGAAPVPAPAPAPPKAQGHGKPVAAAPAPAPAPVKTSKPRPSAPTKNAGHGANVSGPYDPSGVGLPSGNGKGASGGGKPCAGCVGKADAKNPPGQMPGGGDHNAGYECDRNEGIGKTNPAHSGCGSESSVGPIDGKTKAIAANLLELPALLNRVRSGRVPALVPANPTDDSGAVRGLQESKGSSQGNTAPAAVVTPAADRSFADDGRLPTTGFAAGLFALLGAAAFGSGLVMRRRLAAGGAAA